MTGSLRTPSKDELTARASKVRLVVLDVDGVLTDGGLYYGPDGEALKRFDVKDGHGIVMARLTGLPTAVLTARRSKMVEVRGAELGLVAVLQGKKDKRAGLEELLLAQGVPPEACAYMGDDVNDLGPMSVVGFPACPADAAAEVRGQALFISRQPGGHGAVRELMELLLRATGRWEQALSLMRAGPPPPWTPS
jgi:3-deoxy-D-manno-octulosonate 8-phosphate phosphatase (KDO 8-P phosphatase)